MTDGVVRDVAAGETITAVFVAARAAYGAGLSILPPVEDGSKRPQPNADGEWNSYKKTRAAAKEMNRWYPGRSGLGVVVGPANVECWDFDDRQTYEAMRDASKAGGLLPLIERIEDGYCDDTPGGGVRWLVRYPAGVDREREGKGKLARRPKQPDEQRDEKDKVKTLIELPDYAIVAPTNGRVHPTGGCYRRRSGDFPTIASYSVEERDALIGLARSFDQMPKASGRDERPRDSQPVSEDRPGDDFNRRATWGEVLEPHGWRFAFQKGSVTHWCRPGKKSSASATTNFASSDLLYVFSSSTEFEPERGYSKFTAYAILQHGSDFKEAARALAAAGYGTPSAGPAASDHHAAVQENTQAVAKGSHARAEDGAAETAKAALPLTSIGDLIAEPDEIVDYVVEGRIPAGSVCIVAAKPKVGKSTAVRHLSVSVARGETWLDGACHAGVVWYLAFEGRRQDHKAHFRRMGVTAADSLWVYIGQAPKNIIAAVRQRAEQERPALIVIDTLQRFLKASSMDDYAEITTLFDLVLEIARTSGAALVLLHHAGKADRASLDSVLGSTAITGSVDNIFVLARTRHYRTIATIQRVGEDLEERVLVLDEVTGRVSLGPSREVAERQVMGQQLYRALDGAAGPLTQAEWFALVEGRRTSKLAAFRDLFSNDVVSGTRITRLGAGTKISPYRYTTVSENDSSSQVPRSTGNLNLSSSSSYSFSKESPKDSSSQVPAQWVLPSEPLSARELASRSEPPPAAPSASGRHEEAEYERL